TLPVVLKIALQVTDAYTLTWFRFVLAAVVMGAWLLARNGLAAFRTLQRADWVLLGLAAVTLIGNYLLYLLGLHYTTPANAQLIIQLAPLLMAVGAVLVFRERFSRGQWLGLAVLASGLLLFFRDQLHAAAASADGYLLGSLLVVLGGVSWAAYALAQKQLLSKLSSAAVMLFIYACASVLLLPLAEPLPLLRLDAWQWAALLYCGFNTVAAYGAFAEALAHWEASRVSVVLALTPMLTMAVVALVHWLDPALVAPERIGALGYVGAVLVVSGSALTSLLGARRHGDAAPAPQLAAGTSRVDAEPIGAAAMATP